ncbi:hypothetical protein AB4Z50_07305 [Paenibacillus sp. 2TAB26]|uniref:hypothetical protein n=1 Tax=Paenibacillus sp. 2TAB26 TaxID=3233005 RepID=UPI003F9ABEA2
MSSKRKHPVLNVAQHMMYTFRWTIFFYWVIFILIYIGVGFLMNAEAIVGPDVDGQEIWESTTISPRLFLLVIGILLTPASLASFVSSGVTRKHFIGGVSLVLVLFSAIFALILTIGYPVEHFIYDKKNWTLELNNPHLFSSSLELGWIFFEYFCLFFAYFGSGWLIGSGFYRFNWKIGVLISVAALLPMMAMEAVLSSDWIGNLLQTGLEVERASLAAVIILAFAVMLCIVALNFMMLRRVSIRKKLF